MFIKSDDDSEYLVGKHKRSVFRRLRRNREELGMKQMFTKLSWTMGGPFAMTVGGALAASETVAYSGLAALPFGTAMLIGATLGPVVRQDAARMLECSGQLIGEDHVLYRLIMTEEVIGSLRWGEIYQDDVDEDDYTQKTKRAVDAFLEFIYPHTHRGKPEISAFVDLEWESEIDEATGKPHGPLHKHPLIVAIADAIYDYDGEFVTHVYNVVKELRADYEKYLLEKFEEHDKEANELGRKLVIMQEANSPHENTSEQKPSYPTGGITGWGI